MTKHKEDTATSRELKKLGRQIMLNHYRLKTKDFIRKVKKELLQN